MKKELGIARCGLACCVCHENQTCPGCHADGCKDREWCENRRCSIERGLKGCWLCVDFPCGKGLLAKPRARAFAQYARERGEEALVERLCANEAAGVRYHYGEEIVGDYDCFDTQEAIWDAIDNGLCYRGLLVKESLADDAILDALEVESTELRRTDGAPRYWTAIRFLSRDARLPDKLAAVMKPGWYADMKLGAYKLAVVAGRALRYAVGDAEGKARALAACREAGVPDRQLDWAE